MNAIARLAASTLLVLSVSACGSNFSLTERFSLSAERDPDRAADICPTPDETLDSASVVYKDATAKLSFHHESLVKIGFTPMELQTMAKMMDEAERLRDDSRRCRAALTE